jgi:two-component system sensor kinase FixL
MAEVAAKPTQPRSASLRLPVLREVVMQYRIAILAISLALALRLALASILAGEASYLLFLPAILIASALGGWGPGLFATVLGLILGLLFVADFHAFSPADIVNAVAFTLVGVGASWRGELLRRSRLAAAANAEAASVREAHVKSILDSVPEAMIVIDERGIMQSFS